MKKAVAFTIVDQNSQKYAKMLANSLRKFHTEEELPLLIYSIDERMLKKDPQFFYRACPYFAKDLIKEYELVIKLDADQIITGDLNHILDNTDYDVGTVLNWNPVDAKLFGMVQVWDITPSDYMNCGLVAMRNAEFIEHWWALCNSKHFDLYQFREQDLLNILIQYGNYKIDCFDWGTTWNGLIAKSHWPKAVLEGDKLVVKKEGEFPERDKELKVLHWAGGNTEKMNYRIAFSDEVIKRLDYLVGDTNG